MDCSLFIYNLFKFREGMLDEELRLSAERHLETCPSCNNLMQEFDSLEITIEQEKAAEPNPFAATRIMQRIDSTFVNPNAPSSPLWIRVLQPVALALALFCGILIGSYTARKGNAVQNQIASTSENIEFLKSNLFISEFADEDKILVINK